MNLQRLEGFYWVARTGGYARAARAFPYPITQPGVHRQVRRLETDLGLRLFERVAKDRVALTPAGQALHAFVAPFFEALPGVMQGLLGESVGGTLRVTAAGLLLRHLLPRWLRRLQTKRPEIRVTLTELSSADLGPLRSGEVDLWIDHLARIPDDIEARQIASAYSFVALPAQHPAARAPRFRFRLKDVEGLPFVAYHRNETLRALQLRALALYGVNVEETHAAESAETLLGFVAAGIGFSLLPSLEPEGPRAKGVTVHRLELPGSVFPVYAAWRRGSQNPLVRAAMALAPELGPDAA